MNPIYLIDFYKVGHVSQYPKDVTQVWSNWTPRYTRVAGQTEVVHFGLQYFIRKYLLKEFGENFFAKPLRYVIAEYKTVIQNTLGVKEPRTDHIEWLHRLGHLPLDIYSVPEGTSVPLGVPSMVLTNTEPEAYWLPNYLETLMSAVLWKPSTSATTAQRYRKLFVKYAKEAGEKDLGFVDWMGHDFSMRGMSGVEDAVLSGMGHLLSFNGTDSVPAILTAREYYDADLSIGGSVPATEHSVMCAGCEDGELQTFRRLIEDVYPSGVVSIVSDTWDLWRVLTEYIPALRKKILERDGKVVIRPDSGDPVKIICGDPAFEDIAHGYNTGKHPAFFGTLRLLAGALGVDFRGQELPLIKKGGAIYGDSITIERADAILRKTIDMGLSPYNVVFGIGSYTYEYTTRDVYGFAMKATAVRRNGEVVSIFKAPVTDAKDNSKVSHKGIPTVYQDGGKYVCIQESSPEALDNCAFQKVFSDGQWCVYEDFNAIRGRVRV